MWGIKYNPRNMKSFLVAVTVVRSYHLYTVSKLFVSFYPHFLCTNGLIIIGGFNDVFSLMIKNLISTLLCSSHSICTSLNESVWCRPPIMATIKLFRSVRKYFKTMGFYAPSEPNQICPVNRRNGLYIFATAGMFIPLSSFFLFRANSAYEYCNSFCVSIIMIDMTVHFMVFLHKIGSIENLIEAYQKFIEKRKRG